RGAAQQTRNVKDHLRDELHGSASATMRQTYAMRDYKKARQQLENLARSLDEEHPSAAASVREGLLDVQQCETLEGRHNDPSLVLRGNDGGAVTLSQGQSGDERDACPPRSAGTERSHP